MAHLSELERVREIFHEQLKEPEGAVGSAVRAVICNGTGRAAVAPSVTLGVGTRCHVSTHSWSVCSVCNMGSMPFSEFHAR